MVERGEDLSYLIPKPSEALVAKYVLQSAHTSSSGTAEQIPISDFTAVETIDGVTVTSDNLVLNKKGTYVITNRFFTRDNSTSNSRNADISINVREGGAAPLPVLENSRYMVRAPDGQYCRISHEFTMIFKVAAGATKTLYYETESTIGAIVVFGANVATGEYTTIEIMKVD